MKIQNKLSEIFDKSQHGHQNQAKLADGLRTFFLQLKDDERLIFREEFIRFLKPCLVVFTREPAVERVMEFAARFAALFAKTSDEDFEEDAETDDDNFYHYLFNYLFEHHAAQSKAVRFRVCQLVKLLLHVVPKHAALEEDLVERITDCMVMRMIDIIPAVRGQAVRALNRLQQPTENNCPILERYLFLLRCDESAEVRSAVLSCVTMTTRTLPEIIKRVRDVKESVRKLAYQILSQKVGIRALTCTRRLHLVEQGLLDQSEAVRNVVKTQLLQAWLRTYQGNILEVLQKLDAIGSYKTTCKAAQAMFHFAKVDDLVAGFSIVNDCNLITFENLTPESALYWCEICQFLRSKGNDCEELLEKILPSLSEFCEYLEIFFDKFIVVNEEKDSEEAETEAEEKEFIAEQLLKIVAGFDLSDDAGRRQLNETVRKLTSNADVTHFSLIVPALARILTSLYDSDHDSDRVEMAAEMIQDARERSDSDTQSQTKTTITLSEDEMRSKQIQLARIRVKMIEKSEDLDENIGAKNFAEAAEIQRELDALKEEKAEVEQSMEPKISESNEDEENDSPPELKNDPGTILKCLQITKEVCSSISFFDVVKLSDGKTKKRRKNLHPTLLELVNTLILPSVANAFPAIREVAVECLGNCCLYSFDLSAQHLPLFLQIIQADILEVRIKALGCIVDILRIFGVEAFAPKNEKKDEEAEDGSSVAEEDEIDEENYVTTLILTKIVDMLDEDNAEIRSAAASGLAMILVSGRIVSPAIFSRLVLLWYNPTTQDEHSTLNKISCFLDFYPYMCRATHNCIEEALLPTLRTLFEAPNSSPLASVNIQNVAELLVHLTKPSVIRSLHNERGNDNSTNSNKRVKWLEESSAHDSLAVKLCNEILRDPHSVNVSILCRTVSMLELSSNLQDNLKDLTVLCEQILEFLLSETWPNITNLAVTLSYLPFNEAYTWRTMLPPNIRNVKNKQALRYLKKFQRYVLSLVTVQEDHDKTDKENEDLPEVMETSEEMTIQEKTQLILPDGDLDGSEATFHIRKKVKRNGNQSLAAI